MNKAYGVRHVINVLLAVAEPGAGGAVPLLAPMPESTAPLVRRVGGAGGREERRKDVEEGMVTDCCKNRKME
jgi:hypothetical protein